MDKERSEGTTLNVSRNGVFVVSTATKVVNSLIRLKLYLPPNQSAIEVFGKVAWRGKVEGKEGFGVHFMELASSDRQRWLEYASHIEMLTGGGSPTEAPLTQERRFSPRTSASFMVRFKNMARLQDFVSNNMSQGGMFLSTPVLKRLGEKVQLVVIHPTSGKDFEVEAEVIRVNEQDTDEEAKGMALQFATLDEKRQEELKKFVENS